jgi:hypothetical protein
MTLAILFQVLFILTNHWVADFLLQTHDMATKKSTSNEWLTKHVIMYVVGMSATAILVWFMTSSIIAGFLWLAVNGSLHWFTDYFTSRWTSKLYAKQQFYSANKFIKFINFPAFFSVIGLDQVIHYFCLFITYTLFTS